MRNHHDEDYREPDGDEPDACCVLCGDELLGPMHWSRIYNRTVVCHACEREMVRDVVLPAEPAAKKVMLTH